GGGHFLSCPSSHSRIIVARGEEILRSRMQRGLRPVIISGVKPLAHDSIGLCRACEHARVIAHPRGGDPYWRCGLADRDARFRKFPPLPVRACDGFEEGTPQASP